MIDKHRVKLVEQLVHGPCVEVAVPSPPKGVAERAVASTPLIITSYFRARSVEPTTATELVARLNVVFPNVSLADENGRGQLPSAINVPLRKLEQRIAELPREYEIAGYCVLSFEAMDAPRSRGFNVRRIGEGFPEWKAAGVPIEVVV